MPPKKTMKERVAPSRKEGDDEVQMAGEEGVELLIAEDSGAALPGVMQPIPPLTLVVTPSAQASTKVAASTSQARARAAAVAKAPSTAAAAPSQAVTSTQATTLTQRASASTALTSTQEGIDVEAQAEAEMGVKHTKQQDKSSWLRQPPIHLRQQ